MELPQPDLHDHAVLSTASILASSTGFATEAAILSGSLIARLKSRIPLPSAPPTSPSLLGPKRIKMTNNKKEQVSRSEQVHTLSSNPEVFARRIPLLRVRSQLCGSFDSVFVFGALSDLRRSTSHRCHADTVLVDEFSTGLALVEKRTRSDHRGK
jgi:hypothetical protein